MRVASYNTELARKGPGLLLRDIEAGDDPEIAAILDVLIRADADVIALQGFDYDLQGLALAAFADVLGRNVAPYPYRFAAPPNAGRMTPHDLNADGKTGGPRDAQGYGRFFGQGAMALLSRHPIVMADVQDFSALLWRDLPGNLYPMTTAGPWGREAAHAAQRLPSHGAWIVPIDHPSLGRIQIGTFHATPPVFDGPEDRNGRRNHDEVIFWQHILEGHFGPPPKTAFVLMGDANLDPAKGDGRSEAITTLLTHPTLQDPLPGVPTVAWKKVGKMRVDYILPSTDWVVAGAGVITTDQSPSRHKLVWVDLTR